MGGRESVVVQSILPLFVAASKLQVLQKFNRSGKEEKCARKGNIGENKELCEQLISTDCIQLCKRCWEDTEHVT